MSEPTPTDEPQAASPSPFELVGEAAPVCVDGVCELPGTRVEARVEPGP